MKSFLITAASLAILAVPSFAGERITLAPSGKTVKTVVPPAKTIFGTGWYFGPQLGINAYQDFGGTSRFQLGVNDVAIEPREKVGFVGGLKVGYVFGTGSVRAAVEADVFYNGVRSDLDLRVNGNTTDFNADANLNSVGFLANFILRFADGRCQPYIGAGVGGYWAEVDDIDITIAGQDFHPDGGSDTGFAWQLIAGLDYYFNERMSMFGEYKFLNYEDAGFSEDRISQHLVMLGMRFHF